jgi:hypothetical protein
MVMRLGSCASEPLALTGDRTESGLSVPRIVRPFRPVLWVALGVLILSTLVLGGGGATSPGGSGAPPGNVVLCPGSSVSSSYSGRVSIEGGPLTATAAVGVSLSYNYSVEVEVSNRTSGALVSGSCELLQGSADSGTNGSFSFGLTLPASHCYANECTHALGPYGPVDLAPSSGPPSGYESTLQANGTSFDLTFVAELGGLALDPSENSRTLSPNAPGTFDAEPLTAAGSPSPLSPSYSWNLTGTGWSEGSASGASLTVEAVPGAGLAVLTVEASAAVGSNTFSAGPVVVDLEAVPTTFTGGDANRTSLDVGGLVSFTADGTGAPGYTYSADVSPGLGLPSTDWSCSTSSTTGDGVTFACDGAIAYPSAGTADPTVELTNTYSAAEGSLPSVTVAPLPAIAIGPERPAGYAGTPVPLRITAVPGSGTPPYVRACVAPGMGSPLCSASPGPNWTFAPVYSAPGNYTARAWVVDSDGTNRSVDFEVTIVAPLALSAIALPASLPAYAPSELSADLAGGDLPVQYWWNVSGIPGSIAAGRVAADGAVAATWVPNAPGSVDVFLTAIDALGTLVQVTTVAGVEPANASTLAEVTVPGAGPAVAGTPVAVAWEAEDVHGDAVDGFSEGGSLEMVGSPGQPWSAAYVNASGVGPLIETGPGLFAIPSAAWDLGRLALTVATTRTGTFELRLTGPGLFNSTGTLGVDVVADLDHLHFYDPSIAQAGPRDNRTFWRLADEYGNPAPGAAVDIVYSSGGTSSESIVPVGAAGDGATGVWVNFTAPSDAGGSREVTDPAGTILLGPIAVPAASSPAVGLSAPALTLVTAVPVGAVGLGLTAWAQRRRRAARAGDARPTDEDLRRLVAGRDRVVALVRDARALDLTGLEAAWGSTPAPAELADWVASLVADGTLGARTGPDGVARFCLVASADGPPIVLLDPAALDRATAARRELTEERDPGSPRD